MSKHCLFFPLKVKYSARFGSTYTKIGTIQRLAWPLHKDDTQILEAFHIFVCPAAPGQARPLPEPTGLVSICLDSWTIKLVAPTLSLHLLCGLACLHAAAAAHGSQRFVSQTAGALRRGRSGQGHVENRHLDALCVSLSQTACSSGPFG